MLLVLSNISNENREIGEFDMENKKMKLWKKILIIVAIIVLIFIIVISRKAIILNNIDNKVSNLENSNDNIYAEIVTDKYKVKKYIKNEIEKIVLESKDENEEISKIIQITYPDKRKVFTEKDGTKTMNIYEETAPVRGAHIEENTNASYTAITNFAYSISLPENILNSIFTSINSVELNGKECYELTSKYNSNFIYSQNTKQMKAYVEKDTGLPLKLIEVVNENGENIEKVTTYKYEFNIVTDDDIKEPDSQEYIMQE